jgi:hypothetical protein
LDFTHVRQNFKLIQEDFDEESDISIADRGWFLLCFVAGTAFHSIPGVTVAAAQEKRDAMADVARARDLLKEARNLLASAPGEFGGHRDKAIKKVDEALGEANEALATRAHENH